MKLSALILFSCAFLMPARLRAANNCPWLTKGSAETALGGNVSVNVQVSDSGTGTCTFSRVQATTKDGFKDVLKISVQKAPQANCPSGSPKLTGIGNEAVLCTVQRSPEESVEMIVSRVRELHFTISMTSHKKPPKSTEANYADSPIEQIAEQVAGNLF